MMQRPRLLIIDDDTIFRRRISSVLGKDFFVVTAGDGKEGFERALEHSPDVAILDIRMPVWDGIWTLKQFRENENLASVPVLIISSVSHREIVLQAKRLGADDYLIKSEALQGRVHARLMALLERKRRGEFEARTSRNGDDGVMETVPTKPELTSEEICRDFEDGF